MNTFYNTTHEKEPDISKIREMAGKQQDIVYDIFKNSPEELLTPWQAWGFMPDGIPITSVRRAITNLTIAGKLEKTEIKRMGPYGKNAYCWRIKTGQKTIWD